MYPEHLVTPMREDLTEVGFTELLTATDVEQILTKEKDSVLIVINSVCGCAAANARPGVKVAIKNLKRPSHLTTVFAGVDKEAVAKVREYMAPSPPSSPCIALFKDGKILHMLERHHIEGRSADLISDNLISAFDEFC